MSTVAVIGLGYVGMPLAIEATKAGHKVYGVDTSERIVEGLKAGNSHVDDLTNESVAQALDIGFEPSLDPKVLELADVVVICVPTPLSDSGGPDLSYVEDAARKVAEHLPHGQLVVLESTTYPGTTEEVILPLLSAGGRELGSDFFLAFSPERIDPGNPTYGLRNTPKVVGGVDSASSDRAAAFYRTVVDEVVIAKGAREAEMTKLLENTYRHINIALMNEMVRFCHDLDIDLWDAIACARTKPFGFNAFYPGPGVGGHCIPIDPNYLSHRVKASLGLPFRFVELAQEINAGMPAYVARRAQDLLNEEQLPVAGSKILLLGVTYKADISDQRESPAKEVARILADLKANLTYWDPYVDTWSINGTAIPRALDAVKSAAEADLVILLQAHSALDTEEILGAATTTLDTRGLLAGKHVERL